MEMNRRQSECLKMLEDEYKKLDDDHQRLQIQYEELQKKKISLEDNLDRNSRYINENVDLHVYKNQLETSYRDLKEVNEYCEKEKFELQEQLIDMDNQLQIIRGERDHFMNKLIETEHELKRESV
jgi:predicted  nucleic acid-binding Zn-ribbon protein